MMKNTVIIALVALCAFVLADDAPEAIFPCSFRLTASFRIYNDDGETLATSMNEIIHDNGDFWGWKSQFTGSEFVKTFVEDHEWNIIWRPDVKDANENGTAFRHDLKTGTCYAYSFKDQPTPYNWIQQKTYGIMWFDELVDYNGKEATLYTGFSVGTYGGTDFETQVNYYITNDDKQIVKINGTLEAHKEEIKVYVDSTSLSFDHNIELSPKLFAVSGPCTIHDPPSEPSAEFKAQCYGADHSSSSTLTMSWLVVLIMMLLAIMNF